MLAFKKFWRTKREIQIMTKKVSKKSVWKLFDELIELHEKLFGKKYLL